MAKNVNFLISQRGALRLGGYMSILYIYLYIVYYIQDEGQAKKLLKSSGVWSIFRIVKNDKVKHTNLM